MANEPFPTEQDLAPEGLAAPPAGAFELLSTPTLELTREKIIAIANDLRAKRVRFLQGKADKPAVQKKIAAPITAETKEAVTAHVQGLLGGLKL